MRIAIANHSVPFIFGGAEVLENGLKQKLEEYGHQVVNIRIPVLIHPPHKIIENLLTCRFLQLENIDRFIALKFPVYCIPHANKVVWLLHQYREMYDLWDTPYCGMPKTPHGLNAREAVVQADQTYLPEAKAIFTISKRVTGRLQKYNQIDSQVLYPPLDNADQYQTEACGDYIFYPSRINHIKRQWLAVESMRYVKTGVKLMIAGKPDVPSEGERLHAAIAKYGLSSKVRLLTQWISWEEKLKLFAQALGVLFIPLDEDYGYVTLEAAYAQKALITCRDSGGPLEFVESGKTGWVTDPDPRQLAEALDRLYLDKAKSAHMGAGGKERLLAMNIGWDTVVGRLLA
jgi:glycosyltransferase involved in cell wall biosynthesis